MSEVDNLEKLDRLLDELDRYASNTPSHTEFYSALLDRLKFVSNASSCAILLPVAEDSLCEIARCGEVVPSWRLDVQRGEILHSKAKDSFAVELREDTPVHGYLALHYAEPLTSRELDVLKLLCQAFAEVLVNWQMKGFDEFLQNRLSMLPDVTEGLLRASDNPQACRGFVNDLAVLFKSDRVSVVQGGKQSASVIASSAVPDVAKHSRVAEQLLVQAKSALIQGKAVFVKPEASEGNSSQQEDAGEELMQVHLTVPIREGVDGSFDSAIILEWSEIELAVPQLRIVQTLFPLLLVGWSNRCSSHLAGARSGFFSNQYVRRISLRLATFGLAFLALIAVLTRPSTLYVYADGTLQPIQQKVIFADVDGLVQTVFVEDRQFVSEGQQLLSLRSQQLEIQLQGIRGEMRANFEKRDGLNVLINQLDDAKTDNILQSKWATEIKQLEAEWKALEGQKSLVLSEQEKLNVIAPVKGTVMSDQIQERLDGRPVFRGDPLLKIVDVDGPWRLELKIRDQDSQLVKRQFFGTQQAPEIRFVMTANPELSLTGKANWMSESARNPDGSGPIHDLFAHVELEEILQKHPGATVNAKLACGQQPTWFVWSRPFVEYVQRTFWY